MASIPRRQNRSQPKQDAANTRDSAKLYDGFVAELAKRFQDRFKGIQAIQNFDNGPEFEIALCEVLKSVLPGRCGICRGYVVEQSGKKAGDDIIIYDAMRFPTLRAFGQSLALRERVPAEAVLVYIEAKHTLYLDDSLNSKHEGQQLRKALQQINDVKSLDRASLPLRVNGVLLPHPPVGYPYVRNPWYAMVIARNVAPKTSGTKKALAAATERLKGSVDHLPDIIVAGDTIAVPAIRDGGEKSEITVSPFFCHPTELVFMDAAGMSFAGAIFQMLWALEYIDLGPLPWSKMVIEAFSGGSGETAWETGAEGPIRSRTWPVEGPPLNLTGRPTPKLSGPT